MPSNVWGGSSLLSFGSGCPCYLVANAKDLSSNKQYDISMKSVENCLENLNVYFLEYLFIFSLHAVLNMH